MRAEFEVFAARLLDAGLKFVTSVLIARFLGPADKGILSFAMLLVTWAVMFSNCSLPDSVVVLVSRGQFTAAEAAGSMLVFSLGAGVVVAAIVLGIAHSGVGGLNHLHSIWLLLPLIPCGLFLENGTAVVRSLHLFRAFNVLTLMRSASLLLTTLLAVAWVPDRLLGMVGATALASVLNAAILLFYLARREQWKLPWSTAYVREAFRFGLKGHPRLMLATFNLRFDQLTLGALLRPIELGWYSVAVALSEAVQLIPDAISTVLFPRLARDANGAARLAARATRVTLAVTLSAAVLLMIVVGPFVRWVYGESFLPAARMLMWLGPSIVFFSLSKILWNYIYSTGKPHLTIWSVGAAAAVTVVMIFPMVRHFGGIGAAITSSCAYGVGLIVDLSIARKLSAFGWREFLLPRRSDAPRLN